MGINSGKRKTLKEVKEYFKLQGCELLEDKYINYRTKIKYRCVCGNISYIHLSSFQNGKRCGCHKKSKKNIRIFSSDRIKREVESLGYKFISEKFENKAHTITCICKCGEKRTCQLKGLRRSKYCRKCFNFYNINSLKEIFKKEGCIFLDKVYRNSIPINYICSCGRKSKIRLSDFKSGSRCKECGIKKMILKKFDPAEVPRKFEEAGCKLIDQYTKSSMPMRYICSCGIESKISWNNFYSGKRCFSCAIKRRSGKNHYEWKKDRKKHKQELIFRTKSYNIKRRSYVLLKMSMKATGRVKNKKTAEVLGYDYKALQNHITNHPNYALLENKSWHIDHIFPIKAFLDHGLYDMALINCLENLQPLAAEKNLKKNAKYNEKDFLNWLKKKKVKHDRKNRKEKL